MYLGFYNLKKEPFNITPDPGLLFLSPSHGEALAAVIYGVRQRKGFIAITGEVGVGKTTIIRSFLDRVDKEQVKTIYVFNANISFKTLLKTIFQSMGHVPGTDDVSEMVDRLHLMLINAYKAGRNVVLIIDEVQNMPVETLENLRMLSNLETSTDKLIQIVLSGQPEFEEKINSHALRQLKQRIAIRVKIMPLSRAESLAYINHRLARTAIKESEIFSKGALHTIVDEGGGIPRIINILCDNCLITSFGNQQKKVSAKVAREIIADIRTGGTTRPRWIIPGLISTAIALCVFWGFAKSGLPVPGLAKPVGLLNKPVEAESPPVAIAYPNAQPQNLHDAVSDKDNVQAGQPASGGSADKQLPAAGIAQEPGKVTTIVPRVVKKGDTLAELIKVTYGYVDKELLKQVRQNNPEIANVDKIQEGSKIFFPARETN